MTQNSQRNKSKKGSVLILALIMASILLSVGMGIAGIAMKEVKLSSIGNESGIAFYMADTAAECALYWDVKNPYFTDTLNPLFATFPTSSNSIPYLPNSTNNPIRCLGYNLIDSTYPPPLPEFCPPSDPDCTSPVGNYKKDGGWYIKYDNGGSPSTNDATTTFLVSSTPTDLSQPCAVVVVGKHVGASGVLTTINSYGRSSCDNNPRRVERGINVSY